MKTDLKEMKEEQAQINYLYADVTLPTGGVKNPKDFTEAQGESLVKRVHKMRSAGVTQRFAWQAGSAAAVGLVSTGLGLNSNDGGGDGESGTSAETKESLKKVDGIIAAIAPFAAVEPFTLVATGGLLLYRWKLKVRNPPLIAIYATHHRYIRHGTYQDSTLNVHTRTRNVTPRMQNEEMKRKLIACAINELYRMKNLCDHGDSMMLQFAEDAKTALLAVGGKFQEWALEVIDELNEPVEAMVDAINGALSDAAQQVEAFYEEQFKAYLPDVDLQFPFDIPQIPIPIDTSLLESLGEIFTDILPDLLSEVHSFVGVVFKLYTKFRDMKDELRKLNGDLRQSLAAATEAAKLPIEQYPLLPAAIVNLKDWVKKGAKLTKLDVTKVKEVREELSNAGGIQAPSGSINLS
jgi:hypothetical protein